MGQDINVHQFDNGLTLLVEVMDWVESAGFTITIPAGCARDPADKLGLANFTNEMAQRGCGDLNSRQFIESLDRLGADRSASVTQVSSSFAAATLADNLPGVLEVYSKLARQPHFPEDQLEEGRLVCIQELYSFADDLANRCIHTLKHQTYPTPWGRLAIGDEEHVEGITLAEIQEFHRLHYGPNGAIISVAGKVDFEKVKADVARLFGDWKQAERPAITNGPAPCGYRHIEHDSSQTHIAIAYDAVPYRHPDYFQSRGAVGVLSDGMSSRLFTEVREKRGLCYTVFASYHSLKDEGRVITYAGTTAERAQETLDVASAELRKITEGINESELRRLKARVRSALIMQQEVSTARSSAIAADWFHLGRVRPMEEVNSIIDGLTCESVNNFLAANPPGDFTIVTLGSEPLEVSLGVS